MSADNQKKTEEADKKLEKTQEIKRETKKELSLEEKLKESEDKLLRSLAEIENQRRRF